MNQEILKFIREIYNEKYMLGFILLHAARFTTNIIKM